jgi:HlyD family secretion protein
MDMKRMAAALALCLAVAMVGGCGSGQSQTAVSVESVANITGMGNVGITDKFSGLVVSQEEVKIQKNADMTVKELKVSAGDEVKKGDVLFTYDTDELSINLEKQKLELEQLNNTIKSKEQEKKELEKEKAKAPSSAKLEYTIEIQTAEAEIHEAEYSVKEKEAEIKKTEKSLKDSGVTSPIDGRVKNVQKEDNSSEGSMDMGGSEEGADAYITLMKSGSYQVKGTVNEMSAQVLQEGTPLLIRSRIDAAQTWTGSLERIDFENTVQNNNDMHGSSDEMTTSTKYPFYVALDTQEGLMLGQHVYIETDTGDGEGEGEPAMKLPSYYIVDADSDAYVWAEGSGSKLEKRKVTLGEYDAETEMYAVLDGLTVDDYIAFPSEECVNGAPTEHYDPNSGEENPAGNEGGAGMTGGMDEGGAGMTGGMDEGGADMTDGMDEGGADMTDGMDEGGADMTDGMDEGDTYPADDVDMGESDVDMGGTEIDGMVAGSGIFMGEE